MRFVKSFVSGTTASGLAEAINKWVEENNVSVVDMKFTSNMDAEGDMTYTGFVIYEAERPITG